MSELAAELPVSARLNQNRWIADCPDCGGAEFVWIESPLLMCQSCFNAVVDGRWRRVTVPVDRQAIEEVLLRRPLAMHRNWEPGETIAQLKAENVAHGLVDTDELELLEGDN